MDTKLAEQEVTDFVGKNAGYYYTRWTLRIPGEFGQRFQFNSDTDSDSFRTAIPIQIGQ
jgi:hypothetical protein